MSRVLELFEAHHRAVFRFLRRATGSDADAEDLTQEVFMRVVRALPSYEERALGRAWVFRIARNIWRDRERTHRRRPPIEPLDVQTISRPARQAAGLEIDEALAQIKIEDREVFLLREMGGLGYSEIAELTGRTESAVRNRIHRARLGLRRVLCGRREALSVGLGAETGGEK